MNPELLSLLGILVGTGLFIFLAFKGLPVLFVGPVVAMIVAAFSGENVIAMLAGPFMTSFSNFTKNYFLMIMLSAIFGKMMSFSGAADAIAFKLGKMAKKAKTKNGQKVLAVLSIVMINAVLTYGGVSLYAAVFTLVAIAKKIFEELDVPWRFYTCSSLGSGVFTMTMLPGTPAIHNIIPTKYFGTTPMSAPMLGIISAILAMLLGILYIQFIVKRSEKKEEGFYPSGEIISTVYPNVGEFKDLPLIKCLGPSIILLIVLNVLKQPVVLALMAAIVSTYIIFFNDFKNNPIKMLNEAIANSVGAVANVCSATGFGGVVAAVSGYQYVLNALENVPGPAILQIFIAVNIAAGITGAGSGGLVICLDNLSEKFLATGINPQILHRISSMSSGGLDSLPHCGAVVNTLSTSKLSHKQGYINYFFMTVLIPLVVTMVAMVLASLGVV